MNEYEELYRPYVAGWKVLGNRQEITGRCPFHDDAHASFSVNLEKGLWKCHAGCGGGNAVNFRRRMGIRENGNGGEGWVASYDYTDEGGTVLFQVCRFAPKAFRQRRPDGHGGWMWGLGETRRVIYRLADLCRTREMAGPIVVVEGEKDADALWRKAVRATTNPMGAGKWRSEYADQLVDLHADIIVIADQDEVGRRHALDVAKSCRDRGGQNVRVLLSLPDVGEKGDISDWLPGRPEEEVTAILASAEPFSSDMLGMVGISDVSASVSVVKSLAELADEYTTYIENLLKRRIMFGLPEIDEACRGIVPGEVAFVLARSKVGKSAWVQNVLITLAEQQQASLFVSMEQPGTMVFERHMQMTTGFSGREIEAYWRDVKEREALLQRLMSYAPFCWTTERGRVKVEDIAELVDEAKQRSGLPMACVAIDYLGYLDMNGWGSSVYERVSEAARAMKRVAKDLDLPLVVVAQTGREVGGEGNLPLTMEAGRDAGAIEETADIEIGLYQPLMHAEPDETAITLAVQVLANRRGRRHEVWYRMNRASLRIDPHPVERTLPAKSRRRKGASEQDDPALSGVPF